MLAELVPDANRRRCHPTISLGEGKAYREILEVATDGPADLIVMGVHGRNPIDLMLFRSTTNQVVRRATRTVLTLKASWPVRVICTALSGGASRPAALLLAQILPVSSVVAPCHPGAALRNPLHN